MKKLIIMTLLVAALSLSAVAAEMVGYISETHCGAKHVKGSASDVACVKGCLKNGGTPVFVTESDHKVVPITNTDKVQDYLGQKVKVTGTVDNDKLTIESIDKAE